MTSGLDALHLRLTDFEGPLPLLLHLIERNELEVTRVSVAAVADQFLDLVGSLGATDLTTTGEFLSAAARLLLIKSRALLYRRELGIDASSDEDDAETLARQIAEYARFKQVAGAIGVKLEAEAITRPRQVAVESNEFRAPPPRFNLHALHRSGVRLLQRAPSGTLEPDPWPDIAYRDLRAGLLAEVRRLGQTTFAALSSTAWHPLVVVTMFLALLDAVRTQQLCFNQPEAFGPISVSLASTSFVYA